MPYSVDFHRHTKHTYFAVIAAEPDDLTEFLDENPDSKGLINEVGIMCAVFVQHVFRCRN